MRYFITGEWNRHALLRLLMMLFVLYVTGLVITNALMFFHYLGVDPAAVTKYYLGSEAEFLPPKSYDGLLETTHMHMFAMGMLFVTLTHLLLFIDIPTTSKLVLSVALFASGLGDIGSGWLILYVHPIFAYLKITSFILLELTMVAILGLIVWSIVHGRKLSFK